MGNRGPSQGCSLLRLVKIAFGLDGSSADAGKGSCSHGVDFVQGKTRDHMEDFHCAEYRKNNGHDLALFAIFDGHCGDRVPIYLKNTLFDNILEQHNFWEDPESAIRNAYNSTNQSILDKSAELGRGGSTAVIAIVIDGKDIWVANVGDSKAVICRGGVAGQLSVDHEPHSEREKIEERGGSVIFHKGVARVDGQLAVSRAFGDKKYKNHISSEPNIRQVRIDSSIRFMILASDGLWKVMTNQEAVNLVKSIRDPQTAAESLKTEALARKSADDVSCIVVSFNSRHLKNIFVVEHCFFA